MFSTSGSSTHPGVTDSTSVAPRCPASIAFISAAAASTIGSSTFACFTMNSRMMPMRMPLSAPGSPLVIALGVGLARQARARHRGEDVARIVIAVDRILERVQHPHRIGDGAAVDPGAIVVDLGADGAAEKRQMRLVRQDQRHRIVIGRPAARLAGLLAEAAHHQVRADGDAGARARADRGGARRVVGVARIAGPGAALIAEHRGKHLRRKILPARIAGPASVVFGGVRLGEDDRAGVAQPRHQRVVARRKIHVVGGIGAAGRAHVLGVERILERERDAVHRHRRKIGIAAVLLVELVGALERVRLLAEFLAHRGRSGRQRSGGGMPVEVALAGDRALAADVEHAERAHLPGVWNPDGHPELLLHGRVGGGRLHPSELDRRGLLRVAVAQLRGGTRRGLVFAVARQVIRRHVLGDKPIAGAVVGRARG